MSLSRWEWGIVAVGFIGLFVFGAAIRWWANPGYEPIAFDEVQWAEADKETRGYMVRDMLTRHQMVGMTRDEISEILGPPERDPVGLQRYCYSLGFMGRNPEMPFFMEYSLVISFDDANRATHAGIAE